MSEFNYTKCTKPFTSQEEARNFMLSKKLLGSILIREDGTYTAVCPTYPSGYYPDCPDCEGYGFRTVYPDDAEAKLYHEENA